MADPDPGTSDLGHLRSIMVKKLLVERQDRPAQMQSQPVANPSSTLIPIVKDLYGGRAMNATWGSFGIAIALLISPSLATAEEKDKDPVAVIALGAAGEWGFPGGKFSHGPSAAVEFSLIKDWVEVEIGGARLFRRGVSEWEGEVVFRKPFTLSETTEFMIGLGPIWTKASGEPAKLGTTFMADFMFWSSPEKKYGWFIEPGYSISKGERSLGISVGLIFGIH